MHVRASFALLFSLTAALAFGDIIFQEEVDESEQFPAHSKGLKDAHGDPLPEYAIARMGTLRFRDAFNGIDAIAFSPEGKAIAANDWSGAVRFWDAKSGHRSPKVFAMPNFAGNGRVDRAYLIYFQKGKRLLSGTDGSTIAIFDVEAGKALCSLEGAEQGVHGLAVRPDGTVVAGVSNGKVQFWDAKTGKQSGTFDKQKDITSIAYSPDGKIFATGHKDKQITLWNVENQKEIRTIKRAGAAVTALAFTRDGETLCSGDQEDGIYLWNVKDGERIRRWNLRGLFEGRAIHFINGEEISGIRRVDYSPDGKILAIRNLTNGVTFWDQAKGKKLPVGPKGRTHYGPSAFSPDSSLIAVNCGQSVRLWDVAKQEFTPPGHSGQVMDLRFTPDGKNLITSGSDGAIISWKVERGVFDRVLEAGQGQYYGYAQILGAEADWFAFPGVGKVTIRYFDKAKRHRNLMAPVSCQQLAPSPDGKLLAGMDGHRAAIWDVATSKQLRVIDDRPKGGDDRFWAGGHQSFCISPDNRLIAFTGNNGVPQTWEIESGRKVRSLGELPDPNEFGGFYHVLFTPDSRILLAANEGSNELYLREVATGKLIRTIDNGNPVSHLGITRDGKLLLIGDHSGHISVRSIETGDRIADLHGHRGQITGITQSPDGKYIASCAIDSTAVVWDLASIKLPEKKALVDISDKEMATLWTDLASSDSAKAYEAIFRLASSKKAEEFLRGKYEASKKPQKQVTEKEILDMIAKLDSDDYGTRIKADKDLVQTGVAALAILKKKLKEKPASPELSRRMVGIVGIIASNSANADLVWIRACAVLEHRGGDEGKKTLEILAKDDHPVQSQAKAALGRVR